MKEEGRLSVRKSRQKRKADSESLDGGSDAEAPDAAVVAQKDADVTAEAGPAHKKPKKRRKKKPRGERGTEEERQAKREKREKHDLMLERKGR